METIEYRRSDGSLIGTICVDWGRANWRPNQLYAGFVPPQVIAQGDGTPESNEALVDIAQRWFRENHPAATIRRLDKGEEGEER